MFKTAPLISSGPVLHSNEADAVEIDPFARFDNIDPAHAEYARDLTQSVALGLVHAGQFAFWEQKHVEAQGNTVVQNQLLHNMIFANYMATEGATAEMEAAWLAYLSWLGNDWNGYANSFYGYHGWWLNEGGSQAHPNVYITNLL